MKRSRGSEEQMAAIRREQDIRTEDAELCRKYNIHPTTFDQWKMKSGGIGRIDLSRVRHLESEVTNLKRTIAELTLDNAVLRGLLSNELPLASDELSD